MPAQPKLFALGESLIGSVWEALHVDGNRVIGCFRELITAKADGKVELRIDVVAPRCDGSTDAQLLPRLPIAQRNGRVQNRRFDLEGERFALLCRELGA